jgi:hypothetical protein
MKRTASLFALAVFAFTAIHAFAAGEAKKPAAAGEAKKPAAAAEGEKSNRHYATLRGEIVDFYCYIEKGLTGPAHKECGTRCVAGDICMGLLTTEGDLFMISRNHLRAMDPLAFKGIPDPFNLCTGWITEQVDLSGYAMERKGQRIIEIMAVKKAVGPPPRMGGSPPPESQ